MSFREIQNAVAALPAEEKKRLTAWMVASYPALDVETLMARASRMIEEGNWHPEPPTGENIPTGATLDRVLDTAERLGLRK